MNRSLVRCLCLFLTLIVGLAMAAPSVQAGSVVLVDNLQPSWTAPGGGGVYAAYYGPPDYAAVSPGTTAIYDGRGQASSRLVSPSIRLMGFTRTRVSSPLR